MGFRIFGTPQGIEGSANNLDDVLDQDALKQKRGIQGGTMSQAVQGVNLKRLTEEEKEEGRG